MRRGWGYLLFQLLFVVDQTKWNCSAGGVSITLDVEHYFSGPTPIRLAVASMVRLFACVEPTSDIFWVKIIFFHDFSGNIGHACNSSFEDRLSILKYIMFAGINCFVCRRFHRSAGFLMEKALPAPSLRRIGIQYTITFCVRPRRTAPAPRHQTIHRVVLSV